MTHAVVTIPRHRGSPYWNAVSRGVRLRQLEHDVVGKLDGARRVEDPLLDTTGTLHEDVALHHLLDSTPL